MKINQKLLKTGLKNQLETILHMLVFHVISFLVFRLSHVGTKPTGHIYGQFFAIVEYKANLFFVIFSFTLFLVLYSIFNRKFLIKNFKKQLKVHWLFVVLFSIIYIIFCIVEFVLLVITSLFSTGLFTTTLYYPNALYWLVLIYIVGYPLISILQEILNKKHKKR